MCLFIPSRVCLFLHNDTIHLRSTASSSSRRDQTMLQQRRDNHDDIRVETFCRNRAASALPLTAILPFVFLYPPLPCKSDWSGAGVRRRTCVCVSCFVT